MSMIERWRIKTDPSLVISDNTLHNDITIEEACANQKIVNCTETLRTHPSNNAFSSLTFVCLPKSAAFCLGQHFCLVHDVSVEPHNSFSTLLQSTKSSGKCNFNCVYCIMKCNKNILKMITYLIL